MTGNASHVSNQGISGVFSHSNLSTNKCMETLPHSNASLGCAFALINAKSVHIRKIAMSLLFIPQSRLI